MKFLTGLLRRLKFKRVTDEGNEKSGKSEKAAVKPRRVKVIITGVTLLLLIILGYAAWGIFFSAETMPMKNAEALVSISGADMALFQAVRGGSVQDVRRCLSEGGSPYAADKLGVTPFKAAVALGNIDAVREFVESASGDLAVQWNSLLVYAVVQNRPHIVKELVKLPLLNLNSPDKNGYTPLLYSIDRNHLAVVRELLNAGADANARGRDGVTPLIAAVTRGKHYIVAELLKAGADWKTPSPSGETAIGLARARNREIIIALLTEAETPSINTYGI